jgi:uncharacterized protein (TIGR02246 family)
MRRLAAALAVAPLLAACAPKSAPADSTAAPAAVAAPAPADSRADEDSLRAISTRIVTAMTNHDTAAVAALYADDGVDFSPNTPPARGRAEVLKEYGAMFGSMKDLKLTMSPPDVIVARSGDLAVSRSPYEMTWTDAKGKPAKDNGNVLIAWKKVNGVWKVATSMNASAVPAPSM